MAGVLRVLADPARLQLVSILAGRPGLEACVCDLNESLELSQPTVSHHLRMLADAGVVPREQRAGGRSSAWSRRSSGSCGRPCRSSRSG